MSLRWFFFFFLLTLSVSAQKPLPPTLHPDPAGALADYQKNLAQLRQQHPNHRELPNLKFFLFGMGDRLKLIYRKGRLLNALTGNIEEQWHVEEEIIVPSEYLVHLTLTDGQTIQIREDETGVWLLQTGRRPRLIPGTRSRVNLPRFANHPFGPILRVLHQEVLINVINGRPVPNFLVYFKPSYRDAALMAMVMRETNNLPLIHDWIMAIRDPFDRNNRGIPEADNLGEVLFLVSLVSDKSHPAVQMVLDSVKQFQKGAYIVGKTNNAEHPVFQTKWLKYGLKSLGLPDSYTIPKEYDSYSSRFWMDYKSEYVAPVSVEDKKIDETSGANYPYLAWAEDHFYKGKRGMVNNLDYPMSWEQQASNAHYPGLTVLDKEFVKQKLAFPHAWHAAEMFLLLYEDK
ncbi:hypothetical protein GO755_23190 [Spirosoma sp. HMF4905]|uniref:Uncharacterized protein n=1 Tax=Spirosoma arboris TaxID=2682092 RepID=A0A7K1SGM9_9BACT|nr:hypothetical protein [Spirosoma arboris]MVM32965.1 hypothetical protein [Spirosoma arboris]